MTKLDYYKEQMEIDYFAYFSKSYFAFNCYIKDKYPKLTDDRAKINKVKEEPHLQEKFRKLLTENNMFFYNLVDLKNNLNSLEVKNNGNSITFKNVKIRQIDNKVEVLDDEKYYIAILPSDKIIFSDKNNKDEKFTCSLDEFDINFNKLSHISEIDKNNILKNKEIKLNNYYEDVSKNIHELEKKIKSKNIVSTIEETNFIIYKAFIEVIYLLRNALFHSEIDPTNNETKISYEKSYWLFRDFVKILS